MRRLAVAILAAAACGDDGAAPGDELVGVWGSDLGGGCVSVLRLDRGGDYGSTVACPIEGGGYGAEVWIGTWVVDESGLSVRAGRSSCPDASPLLERLAYALEGDVLTLTAADGAITFKRAKGDSQGDLQVEFGCWAEDGSFKPSPVTEL